MWMAQGLNQKRVGTVSVLVVMKFDARYQFVISMSVLVIPLVVHLVRFSIIHFFCILVPAWLFLLCIWFSLIVIWTQLHIHHQIVFQLRQVRYVWDWVWCGPHMIPQVKLGNILDMAWLIARFGHLGIPNGWVVLCLLMGYVVHPLVNNFCCPYIWYSCFIFTL